MNGDQYIVSFKKRSPGLFRGEFVKLPKKEFVEMLKGAFVDGYNDGWEAHERHDRGLVRQFLKKADCVDE